MNPVVDFLKREWDVLKGAFWSVLTLVLLTGGGTWLFTNVLYSERIATLDARIDALKEDVERAKMPDVASEDRSPALPDFTPEELKRLKQMLSESPSFIEIWQGQGSSPWTDTIKKTFAASGWKVGEFTPSSVFAKAEAPVMLRWDRPEDGAVIEGAFKNAGINDYRIDETSDGKMILTFWAHADLGTREPPKP